MKAVMHNLLIISLIISMTLCFSILSHINHTSQTAIFTMPPYHNIALWSAVWEELIAKKYDTPHKCAIQVIPFYQKSFNDDTARSYFSLDCKDVLLVAGDQSSQVHNRDIRSEWLGINDPEYIGYLTLQPQQKQYGAIISFNQQCNLFCEHHKVLKKLWIDITIPIFHVKNRLNTTGSSPEVIQAFNDNSMQIGQQLQFARITNKTSTKTGIATIEIRLGGVFIDRNNFFLDYYTGICIPTEGKPSPTRLFPATLGNQGHWILLNGGHIKLPLLCFENGSALQLFLYIENLYYFHNHQYRTLDLFNKQYSRYLPVRRAEEVTTIPAANILTQLMRVKPESFVSLATGISMNNEGLRGELGFLLWSHTGEDVSRPDDCCAKGLPAYASYGIADTSTPITTASSSLSTISTLAQADPAFITIKSTDLEFRSGAACTSSVQGIYYGLYREKCYKEHTLTAGIAGSFMFPNNNSALQTWSLWLKGTIDF